MLQPEIGGLRASLDRVNRENERLRELLELPPAPSYDTVIARVIARPANQWFSTITLNRGSRDGLSSALTVVSDGGVVGYVESVTPNSARVILLVDARSTFGGRLAGSNADVIVEGTGHPSGAEAVVRPLDQETTMTVGDRVETSGLSTIFPEGLPVGEIISVDPEQSGLRARAVLKPDVDFRKLDWVAVILTTR